MANPAAIREGSAGFKLPLLVGADGTPYIPAAGTAENLAGYDADRAPALIELKAADIVSLIGYHANVFVPFALTAVTTEQALWAPTAGKKFRLLGIHVKSTVEAKLNLLDGTGGTTIFTIGAGDSVAETIDLGALGILSGAINRSLYVTSSASADLVGTVWGIEV